jgi:hypothetical protein
MRILAIDPGPTESAFVHLRDGEIVDKGKAVNDDLIDFLRDTFVDVLVIEKIASYGMPVGEEVFETVYWSGRFAQLAMLDETVIERIPRLKVKLHLCKSPKANDSNIRQALIDRYGGIQATKKGGALHGVSKDIWAALAVGLTYLDTKGDPR